MLSDSILYLFSLNRLQITNKEESYKSYNTTFAVFENTQQGLFKDFLN